MRLEIPEPYSSTSLTGQLDHGLQAMNEETV